ncbi:MAG: hypothetical protein R6U38_00980 [Desulfatiglandaceae bacterium]
MAQSAHTVDHLTRVTLSIEAGTSEMNKNLTPESISHELVVGIGPQGYSPFEYELLGKKMGETLHLTIPAREISRFFEHLDIPLIWNTAADPIHIKVRIDQISIPDQTEVIQAMAALSACGGHCCGGH